MNNSHLAVSTALAGAVLALAWPAQIAAQPVSEWCDCQAWKVSTWWEHRFTSQAVDLGWDDPPENTEGGSCAVYHNLVFCDGFAQAVMDASDPDLGRGDALLAFSERLAALPYDGPDAVDTFLRQFDAVASLEEASATVLVRGCEGVLRIQLEAAADAAPQVTGLEI